MRHFKKSLGCLSLVSMGGLTPAMAQMAPRDSIVGAEGNIKKIKVAKDNKESFTNQSLHEVVVTALGISRKEKALGYSVKTINNDELTSTVSGNWLDNMAGKVAGLSMVGAGTGPLGSMRITLRGDNSLNYGNNSALIVIDGIPMDAGSPTTGSGANYANGDAPVDFGSSLADLNPDDIESVTVLKGAAATALYGSLAGNGAIVITTKKGSTKKGIGVTLNSSVTLDYASYWPDFQKEYGAGSDNGLSPFCFWTLDANEAPDGIATYRNISRYAFGEKFDTSKMRYQYMSKNWETGTYEKLPWVYADDWYTGFFQTGVTWKNTISIAGGNGRGTSARASINDTRNTWITPNTGYRQNSVSLAFETPINKSIKLTANVNYNHKSSDNLPISGYSAQSPMYALVWGYNNNPIKAWKDEYFQGRYNAENYNNTDGTHGNSLVYPANDSYNPYRTAYEEINTLDRNRIYGNAQVNIKILNGLTLNLRSAIDITNDWRTQRKPWYTPNYQAGFYREQSTRSYILNHDFLLQYKNNWLEDRFGLTAAFGGNSLERKYRRTDITLNKLQMDGVYNITNLPSGEIPDIYANKTKKIVNSFYGYAEMSWDGTYYLDLTARNDWSSTLSKSNRSFFYPSVSASILLDRVFNLQDKAHWMNMLKYRLSWANVGNDTSPYSLDRYYSSTSYPGSYTMQGTIPDANLKPENVASWETGFEGKMFNGRLGFDFTAYHTASTNQILTVSADQITGATGYKINAGKITNQGIELSLSGTPVKTRNFSWNIDMNWSKNWNKLVSLQDDWDPQTPLQTSMGTTIGSRVYVYSYVGQQMNYIYGRGYQRAPEGSYYTDENGNQIDCSGMKLIDKNGYPMLDTSPTRRIGKVDPDWKAGMTQTFRYKNLTLAMVFSAQYGGHCFSVTNFALSYQGKLKNSLEGRYDGLVVDGVYKDADGNYHKNTTIVDNIQTYYNSYVWNRNNTEENTFNTSFLKLKMVRLDWQLPKTWLSKKNCPVKSAQIGAYATNLFCLTSFPQYDPEVGMVNGGDVHSGIETMSYPMTRSYGVNVKLSF